MEAIHVSIRIRPEDPNGGECCIHRDPEHSKSIQLSKRKHNDTKDTRSFAFDNIFGPDATQEEVFESVSDLVDESLKGFNVTIFAFGMTGSGKTHTIAGNQTQPGIVPRAVHRVFSNLRSHASFSKDSVAMVFLTYIELYNNVLYDLLGNELPVGDSHSHSSLKLHEHPAKGVYITGSSTIKTPVSSAEEALSLIASGNKLRATSATNLNERSSRSHTVIMLEVVSQDISSGAAKVGKINLVDLAGSERVKLSGSEGQALEEAKQINKALSVLGDVLNSLSKYHMDLQSHSNHPHYHQTSTISTSTAASADTTRDAATLHSSSTSAAATAAVPTTACSSCSGSGSNRGTGVAASSIVSVPHIPFRNSKLTMLLKDSLGGNAKTMMIATVRQSSAFYQQTFMSLQYAARAKHIKCSPIQNVGVTAGEDGGVNSMHHTLEEVTRLRQQLASHMNEFDTLRARLKELEAAKASEGGVNGKTGEGHQEELQRQYRLQIEELQSRSTKERQELQDRMKFVIHSHEGMLAEKEREFISLETRLAHQTKQIKVLSSDKDAALQLKKQTDLTNKELTTRLGQARNEILRLQGENGELKKELSMAREKVKLGEINGTEREQFIDAIKRLTTSRSKHRSRAEELQQALTTYKAAADSDGEKAQLIRFLEQKLADKTSALGALEVQINSSAAERDAQLKTLEALIEAERGRASEAVLKCEQQNEWVADAKEKLKSFEKAVRKLVSSDDKKASEIDVLKKDRERINGQLSQIQNELTESAKARTILQNTIEELRASQLADGAERINSLEELSRERQKREAEQLEQIETSWQRKVAEISMQYEEQLSGLRLQIEALQTTHQSSTDSTYTEPLINTLGATLQMLNRNNQNSPGCTTTTAAATVEADIDNDAQSDDTFVSEISDAPLPGAVQEPSSITKTDSNEDEEGEGGGLAYDDVVLVGEEVAGAVQVEEKEKEKEEDCQKNNNLVSGNREFISYKSNKEQQGDDVSYYDSDNDNDADDADDGHHKRSSADSKHTQRRQQHQHHRPTQAPQCVEIGIQTDETRPASIVVTGGVSDTTAVTTNYCTATPTESSTTTPVSEGLFVVGLGEQFEQGSVRNAALLNPASPGSLTLVTTTTSIDGDSTAALVVPLTAAASATAAVDEVSHRADEGCTITSSINSASISTDTISPRKENQILKGKIQLLVTHEKSMISALEERLHDLDDARSKLLKLKSSIAQDGMSEVQQYILAERDNELKILTAELNDSERKSSHIEAELKTAKSANRELRTELEKCASQLALERQLSKSYLDDLEKTRRETTEELSRAVTMVRQRVEQGQERRQTELFTLVTTGSILGAGGGGDEYSFHSGTESFDTSLSGTEQGNSNSNASRPNRVHTTHHTLRRSACMTPSTSRLPTYPSILSSALLSPAATSGQSSSSATASTFASTSPVSPASLHRLRKFHSEADVPRSVNNKSWRPTSLPPTAEVGGGSRNNSPTPTAAAVDHDDSYHNNHSSSHGTSYSSSGDSLSARGVNNHRGNEGGGSGGSSLADKLVID